MPSKGKADMERHRYFEYAAKYFYMSHLRLGEFVRRGIVR